MQKLEKPEYEEIVSTIEWASLARGLNPADLRRLHEVEALRWKVFPILDEGFVTLVDVMGSDAAVVQAARVSYGAGTKKVSNDAGLIRYLLRNRHTTPFEMAEIKVLIKVPMDHWRQWIRHRTASVNEYSTRYSVAIDEVAGTVPEDWRLQSGSNKQGSSGMLEEWPEGMRHKVCGGAGWVIEHADGGMVPSSRDETPGSYLSRREAELHKLAREVYNERVEDYGVAREQARKDLPLSTYTMAYWKIDLHNLLHFLGLRMDSHAQQEIRQYATVIGEEIVKPLFPAVWDAFTKYRMESTFISGPAKQVLAALQKYAGDPDMLSGGVYSQYAFNVAVGDAHPLWGVADDAGKLKPHREREEVRAMLVALGLLAAE